MKKYKSILTSVIITILSISIVYIYDTPFFFGFFGDTDEVIYETVELKGKGNLIDHFPYGQWTYHYRNGNKKEEGVFNDNSRKDGEWQTWDSLGNFSGVELYNNGKKIN